MRFVLPPAHARSRGRPRGASVVRVRGGTVRRFLCSETGASMAEYALLIAVIALVAAVGGLRLGTAMRNGGNVVAAVFR